MISSRGTVRSLSLSIAVAFFATCGGTTDSRVPSFNVQSSGGCGEVFVYKSNKEGTESVVVIADKKTLGLQTGERSFDLELVREGLEVRIDMFAERPSVSPYYCNDVVMEHAESPRRWKGRSGRVSIRLANRDGLPPGQYQAVVRLENCVFVNEAGQTVSQRTPLTIDAVVGWYPG